MNTDDSRAQPDCARKHVPIEDMEFFRLYESVADAAWDHAIGWTRFAQDTIGKQLVRAADGINLNLAEGDGRYSAPDALHFMVIARGSARECRICVQRAIKRGLMTATAGAEVLDNLVRATKLLNLFINYRRKNASSPTRVREQVAVYAAMDPLSELDWLDLAQDEDQYVQAQKPEDLKTQTSQTPQNTSTPQHPNTSTP